MISPTTTDSEIEDYAAAMMPQLELLTSPYRHYELPYGRFQQYDAVRADGVSVSTMAVEGSDVPLVKHELDIPAPADFVLDLYGRLNYTEIVDPFSFLVRSIQTIQTGGSSRFGWLLVAETIDDMKIPRDSRTRDFCTLDGVDRSRLLQFSKSVDHPLMKEVPFNTVRVPLTYAIRVIPHENDNGSSTTGPSCRVVQIQHSDSALPGLSAKHMTYGVSRFGLEFFRKFRKLAVDAYAAKLGERSASAGAAIGKASPDYLDNPLKSGWNWVAAEAVPQLGAVTAGSKL